MSPQASTFYKNPYRPGAGHMPPYLAGREQERDQFLAQLQQETILNNVVVTGLRGVGKTVLLEKLKPEAMERGWLWVGSDMSESSSVSEDLLAKRIITDLSVSTANIVIEHEKPGLGFGAPAKIERRSIDYNFLYEVYQSTPGLSSDKLKAVFENVYNILSQTDVAGVVFAYDEAQTMSDHANKNEYPLALLLDVFQSIQKRGFRFLLALSGLPTLYPKLVESRTFAERMFMVIQLDRLEDSESKKAIVKPLEDTQSPIRFDNDSVDTIIRSASGYPYFIQFICREAFDAILQVKGENQNLPGISIDTILRKLDRDFFSARYERLSDRQRDLMEIIAATRHASVEFSVQEVAELSKAHERPFSNSHINQMLTAFINKGLVYKNRHGKYCFAVPLWSEFVLRQQERRDEHSV